jgi:hypothetical protein
MFHKPNPKRAGEIRLVICVHTWNPKAPGRTEKEFLSRREEFMKGLMAKKLPVKSKQAALNSEQGKGWCLWEPDTLARMEGIMAEQPNVHTEVIPVKLAPQIM